MPYTERYLDFCRKKVERSRLLLEKMGRQRQLILVSFLVGILCGLAAVLLRHTVHWTHSLVHNMIGSLEESLVLIFLPAIGILLTILFVKYAVREDIGHGVSKILFAISRQQGRIKVHNCYSSMVASSLTIGFGGSVGAESPVVMTGAAIGSNVGRLFHLDYRSLMLMVGCGAAAAIAAIFKAPLAGMVFTLEVLMLDLTMSSLIPLLISSVSATIVSYFLIGNASLFSFTYTVPFDIKHTHYYLILGVFTGLISVYFTRAAMGLEGFFVSMKSTYKRILLGSAIIGGLAFLFPPLLGEGYSAIQTMFEGRTVDLFEHSPLQFVTDSPWLMLVAIFAIFMLKVVAMASTTGAGGVGGSFAPTLFVGGVAGFFLARFLNLSMGAGLDESTFALVGMAGAMAGVMHAPLLGIFLIAELTGGYLLLMPLMITAIIAYITVSAFDKRSIYTKRLAEKGELLTHNKDQSVLTLMQLKNVLETDLIPVNPRDTLRTLVKAVARSHRNIFPVVGDDGRLEGVVQLDQIRSVMFEQGKYDTTNVMDYMTLSPERVQDNEQMSSVMSKFESTSAWNLPVVDSEGRYIGFVSKSKIYSAYRSMLVIFSEE